MRFGRCRRAVGCIGCSRKNSMPEAGGKIVSEESREIRTAYAEMWTRGPEPRLIFNLPEWQEQYEQGQMEVLM